MTEGPYFVVVKGTNQRWTSTEGENAFPKIYDTEEIAQKEIDANRKSRASLNLPSRTEVEPISATEYNEKYAKLMGIEED